MRPMRDARDSRPRLACWRYIWPRARHPTAPFVSAANMGDDAPASSSPRADAYKSDPDESPSSAAERAPAMDPCPSGERGVAFWMVFVSTLLVDMLSAIDLVRATSAHSGPRQALRFWFFRQTAVSTALPTVVERLHGGDFVWAGGAYTIASTAVLPLVGGLVESFGRKPVLLTFVFLFALGSVLCGTATSMHMLIGGRGRFASVSVSSTPCSMRGFFSATGSWKRRKHVCYGHCLR